MHVDLDSVDVPERVKFKLVSTVHYCLQHKAPRYLMDYCIPISDVASRHLPSARRHHLVVPRHSLRSYGCWAFAVAGPTAWNSLTVSDICLKLGCFQSTTHSTLEVSHFMCLLTYLLTYLSRPRSVDRTMTPVLRCPVSTTDYDVTLSSARSFVVFPSCSLLTMSLAWYVFPDSCLVSSRCGYVNCLDCHDINSSLFTPALLRTHSLILAHLIFGKAAR